MDVSKRYILRDGLPLRQLAHKRVNGHICFFIPRALRVIWHPAHCHNRPLNLYPVFFFFYVLYYHSFPHRNPNYIRGKYYNNYVQEKHYYERSIWDLWWINNSHRFLCSLSLTTLPFNLLQSQVQKKICIWLTNFEIGINHLQQQVYFLNAILKYIQVFYWSEMRAQIMNGFYFIIPEERNKVDSYIFNYYGFINKPTF